MHLQDIHAPQDSSRVYIHAHMNNGDALPWQRDLFANYMYDLYILVMY